MGKLTLQVSENALHAVRGIAEIKNTDWQSLVPDLIKVGATDEVLKLYNAGEISLNKVADLLDISVWEAIDLCTKRGVKLQIGRLKNVSGV